MSAQDRSLTPLAIDIEHVICDMNRIFNPLHKDFMLDYKVQATRDGYVLLTIALPEGMTKVFASMLESMSGFFHFMHIKSKSVKAENVVHDPAEVLGREQRLAAFTDKVCALYDGFIHQGQTTKSAVSLVNATLKDQVHPWASYDTIMRVLRSSGRFRKDFKLREC
jgi:hypothetical protein